MNNTFYEMIFKRKSFHIFRNVGDESISENELNDIHKVYLDFTPLNPEIKTAIRIVPEKQSVRNRLRQLQAESKQRRTHNRHSQDRER